MTGKDLKIWRAANGYATQESLRQELEVTRDTISRWERSNDRLPRQLELALLALAALPQCRNIGGAHGDDRLRDGFRKKAIE
jgi:DNA-binding XRE family transcriptional regulator